MCLCTYVFFFQSSILLYHDAPVDCEDYKCRTPLFYATKSGTKSSMVLLKENGAEINHTDVKGKTPIFKARTYNTTKLLLNYGVSAYQDFYSLNLIIIYNLYLFIIYIGKSQQEIYNETYK